MEETQVIWTVSIDRNESGCEAWISAFSIREKRDAFVRQARAKLADYGMLDQVEITTDYCALDSIHYLDWIDDIYGQPHEGEAENEV